MGNKNHYYYRKEFNSLVGPASIACLYDVFSTGLMQLLAPGGASLTNFMVAIADYAQVLVARTNLLGNPEERSQNGEISRQRRIGAMAWTQVISGLSGLGTFLYETIINRESEEEDNISPTQKTLLSATSLLAAMSMLTTYSEKVITATTSKGKTIGNEIKGIMLDARNDIRASVEYLVMSVYPWVRNISPVKKLIDFLVPALALRDGVMNFITDGINKIFFKTPNFKLSDKFTNILKRIFFISNKTDDSHSAVRVPDLIGTNWFLGKEGIRNKFLVPIFESLGCSSIPDVSLQEGIEGNKILSLGVDYSVPPIHDLNEGDKEEQLVLPNSERFIKQAVSAV